MIFYYITTGIPLPDVNSEEKKPDKSSVYITDGWGY